MRLTLSSAAAPDASFDQLVEACRRKGLQGLELVDGDAHGLGPLDPVRAVGVTLTGFRLADPRALPDPVSVSGRGARPPYLVPVTTAAELSGVLEAAAALPGAGARAIVASADPALLVDAARSDPSIGVAWDFVPGSGDPADLERLLDAAGRRLTHVRLFGGGPESMSQGGTGVGTLVARLARAGFSGALVITPSSRSYRLAWNSWLGRRGGWGCSGKATPSEPIALQRAPV